MFPEPIQKNTRTQHYIEKDNTRVGRDYNKKERWMSHKITEDYVNLAGDIMYPKKKFGAFGFNHENLKVFSRIMHT